MFPQVWGDVWITKHSEKGESSHYIALSNLGGTFLVSLVLDESYRIRQVLQSGSAGI